MKFAAVIEYLNDADKVQAIRPVHREYLAGLRERGQLIAAGPFCDGSGALIVYEAASSQEAEKLVQGDPFFQSGILQKFVLRPWNPVIANREAFPG
jgi:uncharacterized protein YciI